MLAWEVAGVRGRLQVSIRRCCSPRGRMKDVYQFLTQGLLLSYPILRALSAAGLSSDAPGKNLASAPECVNTLLCLTVSTCFTVVDFSDCSVNLINGTSISACFTSKIFFF